MNDPTVPPSPFDPPDAFDLEAALGEAEASLAEPHARLADPVPVADALRQLPWRITGIDTAEWAMRKYAEAAARVNAAHEQHTAWVARYDDWLASTTRADRATMDYMAGQLERYALDEREASHDRTKTVVLPSGRVSTRTTKAAVVVTDEDLLLKWMDENLPADIVQTVTTRKIGLTPLRELLAPVERETGWAPVDTSTGEIPPGVDVRPPMLSATVQPA